MSRMFVSYTVLPEGNKTRTIGSLKTVAVAGTQSEERQSQQLKSTDGWIWEGLGGETKAYKQKRSNLVFTQCTREIYCSDEVNL